MVINTPRIDINIKTAVQDKLSEQRVLFVMPYIATEYKKDVDINTLEDSHLKRMMLHFRKINKFTKLSYLSTHQATPVNATATLVINSGVDVDTKLIIKIIDTELEVIIPKNSAIQDISGLILASLITSDLVESASANVSHETITIELSDILAGSLGNGIYFATNNETLITTSVFTGGSLFPSYDLSLIGEDRYQHVVVSNVYDANNVANLLKNRFNVDYVVLSGVGAKTYNTLQEITTENIDNNQCFVKLHIKKTISHIDTASVDFMALRSLRFTDGANLSKFIDNSAGVSNYVGGINLSAIPYHNTNITDYIKIDGVYNQQETIDIEANRISLIDYDITGYVVALGDIYTTYKIDESGNSDNTYKYLNNVDIALNVREYFFNAIKSRTKQSTLATGVALSNRGQLSVDSIKTLLIGVYQDLIGFGIVQDEVGFKENLFVNILNSEGIIQLQYEIYPIQGVRSIQGVLIVKI